MSPDELAQTAAAATPASSPAQPAASPGRESGLQQADPGSVGTRVDIENTDVGGNLSVTNAIQYGDVYIRAQRRTILRSLSFSDGHVVKETEEQWAVEHFAGLEGEADLLVRHLEERRVLLLSGEAGARKATAATHLALRLRQRSLCKELPLLFDSVDRHVRVDVHRMPVKDTQLQDRVVIFRYALSRGNPDLTNVFAKTDRAGWAQLADCLRQRNAYMVFTATPAEIQQFHDVHALREVHRELAPHPPELLARRLDRHLHALRRRGDAAAGALGVLRGFREQLVERFSFAPQLADFVDFFVGLDQHSLGLDEAHALFQDTGKRLLHDLDDDFDGWSFGFALALAQCAPDACGVPWVDFDRLRRHLRRWLQRDLQLAEGPRSGEEEAEPSEVRLELSDHSLLIRSRARVEKDPTTLADVIRFCDGRPPQALWRTLLSRHRRVLTAILPRLRELAERPDLDGRSMSLLAAKIIGRIGEIDYERVVVPMAERWATLGRGRHHGLVGSMYEGVLGSEDPRFRARCLQHLRTMHAGDAMGPGRDRLEAAIAAYSWVGYYDFDLSMRELFGIADAHLVPMIEDATRVSRLVTRIKLDIEKQAGEGDKGAVRAVNEVLRSLVDRIYAQHAGIFLGVQFALVSLCGTHGVAPVLRGLHEEWIRRGGTSMGVLVALMFLHERGIANQLRDDRTEFPQGEGIPPATCGQFVRALGNGDGDVRQAAQFLSALHECVTSPWAAEALVRMHFRDRLKAHLLEWVREALPVPELTAPVRSLIEQLSRTHRGNMHGMIHQLVNGGEFRRDRDLKVFADSLRL